MPLLDGLVPAPVAIGGLVPEPAAHDLDGPIVPAVVQLCRRRKLLVLHPSPYGHRRVDWQNGQDNLDIDERVGVLGKLGLCGHSVSATRMLLELLASYAFISLYKTKKACYAMLRQWRSRDAEDVRTR